MAVVTLKAARPEAEPTRAPVGSPAAARAPLDLSRGAYRLLVGAVAAAYLALWLAHFQYVYGALVDDYFIWYTKGVLTLDNWRNAFGAYTTQMNFAQLYFFLISYLPLKTGISLPSYPLPFSGEQTGQFRFFLLYMVFIHTGILVAWAWFVTKIIGNRLVALLSLLLFVSSPTFILWSPEPDSRLIGLPFVLLGFGLLLRVHAAPAGRPPASLRFYFLTGAIFGIAQCVHWASLYLVAPACAAFWGVMLWRHWRERRYWLQLAVFTVGLLACHLLLEAISFAAGIPLDRGPTATLLWIRDIHVSPWSRLGNLALWGEWFLSLMGVPLLLAIAVGAALYLRPTRTAGAPSATNRLVVSVCVGLGAAYLILAGTMPFFRQTGVLQPFLFLFASVTTVAVAGRLGRSWPVQVGAALAVLVVVGGVQWGEARQVFQAHQGVGEALAWVYEHKGDHPIAWLPVSGVPGGSELTTLAELEAADPETWIVSYFPWTFLASNLSLRPSLEAAPPVASWPTLYATDAIRAETKPYGHNDLRYDPLLRDVRVVEARALQAALPTRPLLVQAVTADSTATDATEPLNVIDHDGSPDGTTVWVSGATPTPHHLDIQLAEPTELSAVQVVLPALETVQPGQNAFGSRIVALTIQAATATGAYRTIWRGQDLARAPTITAAWPPVRTDALRLIVDGQTYTQGATEQAAIEEIALPGYRLLGPLPQRLLPPLVLQDLQPDGQSLVVSGQSITPRTDLVLDGVRVPLRPSPDGQMRAVPPPGARLDDEHVEAYLVDDFRRSNVVTGAPRLTGLAPASTSAGARFNVQADGSSSTLTIDCEGATPGTTVYFDTLQLVALHDSSCPVIALLRPELLAQPGRHVVRLSNRFGSSNSLDFAVDVPVGPAPVLQGLAPTTVVAEAPFDVQADGRSRLAIAAENATPDTQVLFDGTTLATTYRDARTLVAAVPRELTTDPAEHAIWLKNVYGESERRTLAVTEATTRPPVLRALDPPGTLRGTPFNAQPDGRSTLRIAGEDLTRSTVVLFNGNALDTTYQDEHSLTSLVPQQFLDLAGEYTVTVQNSLGQSNAVALTVADLTTPPVLKGIQPAATEVNTPFGAQSDGSSTLLVDADDAPRGTIVLFDGTALETDYRGPDTLAARVPPAFMTATGEHRITLRNPRGDSATLDFTVTDGAAGPPVLTALRPAVATLGQPLDPQAADPTTLHLEGERATRGTSVVFDGVTLPATYVSERELTAVIPPAYLAVAGRHTIQLRNGAGDSTPLDFVVSEGAAPPVLTALRPAVATLGQPLDPQAADPTTLRLEGERATRGTIVLFDGVSLPATYMSERELSAVIPSDFLAVPGRHTIQLRNGAGDSAPLEFVVSEGAAPPVLKQLTPAVSRVGVPFEVEPDGSSTLRVQAEHATPGTAVMFDTVTLNTRYVDEHTLEATVPAAFLAQATPHTIRLRNTVGESNELVFAVQP